MQGIYEILWKSPSSLAEETRFYSRVPAPPLFFLAGGDRAIICTYMTVMCQRREAKLQCCTRPYYCPHRNHAVDVAVIAGRWQAGKAAASGNQDRGVVVAEFSFMVWGRVCSSRLLLSVRVPVVSFGVAQSLDCGVTILSCWGGVLFCFSVLLRA